MANSVLQNLRSFLGRYFRPLLLLVLLTGWIAGLGVYTFQYAKGTSYLSDDPAACANCHVMNTVYEGWNKGGHQHVATCNDCHVPHDFIGKWFTKASNGFHHSYAFTFKDIPLHIQARAASREVVQNNCIRCHSDMARSPACGADGQQEALSCKSCHREVGHPHN